MPAFETIDPVALFHSVSDATRLRLLRLLSGEELNVQEMVKITGLSQPGVSKHLAVLREQGWLQQRREGTYNWYSVVDEDDFAPGNTVHQQVLRLAQGVPGATDDDLRLVRVLDDRQERQRDFFAGIADRWDDIRQEFEHPDIQVGAVAALVPADLEILDIGTGTGAMLPVFGQTGARVVALDRSEAMLNRARDLCRREQLDQIRFCNGGVEKLPFADRAFDACHCAMVLHHVTEPGAAVAEMSRVVRPGGRVLVTAFLAHDQDWMKEELAHRWLGFSRDQILDFYTRAGLVLETFLVRETLSGHEADRGRSGPGGNRWKWPRVFLAAGIKNEQGDG